MLNIRTYVRLDVLNVFLIINRAFFERTNIVFNPRNNMYISHIDGKLDSRVLVQRDTLINANTLMWMGRNKYTKKAMDKLVALRKKQEKLFQ